MGIDYTQKIPNNVDLAGDRRLQRALEHWQPRYLDWWNQLGPDALMLSSLWRATIRLHFSSFSLSCFCLSHPSALDGLRGIGEAVNALDSLNPTATKITKLFTSIIALFLI